MFCRLDKDRADPAGPDGLMHRQLPNRSGTSDEHVVHATCRHWESRRLTNHEVVDFATSGAFHRLSGARSCPPRARQVLNGQRQNDLGHDDQPARQDSVWPSRFPCADLAFSRAADAHHLLAKHAMQHRSAVFRLRVRDAGLFGVGSAGSTAVPLCCTWIHAQARVRWTYRCRECRRQVTSIGGAVGRGHVRDC